VLQRDIVAVFKSLVFHGLPPNIIICAGSEKICIHSDPGIPHFPPVADTPPSTANLTPQKQGADGHRALCLIFSFDIYTLYHDFLKLQSQPS
jgi:hypothetical protein